ncbi:MAG: type II toxin-antitoxin system HicA family toxin [Patescibacteria group bacterium]|nr:type II toxin-antitoxin system HicA family toxin [Patescibacteria group bacterium]MDE2218443.1 type II toxin-antitoxin system HicA family toxin [Patescibacteria group bacterium]
MPRGLFNWTAEDAIRFLKEYKFFHTYTKGSHMFYFGHYNGRPRQVCIPFHGKRVLKPRTLKGIIQQSGIYQKEWLKN